MIGLYRSHKIAADMSKKLTGVPFNPTTGLSILPAAFGGEEKVIPALPDADNTPVESIAKVRVR